MDTPTYVKGLYMSVVRMGTPATARLTTSIDGTNWVLYGPSLPYGGFAATDGNRLISLVWSEPTNSGPFNYNSFVNVSDPLVATRMTNPTPPQVALSGLVGRKYQIQSTDSLKPSSNNWITNATIQLTNSPFVWTDATATNAQRFYRGVLLP
jgi:hypothetical protein